MIQYNIKVDRDQVADAVSLFEFFGGNTTDAVRIAINRSVRKIKNRQERFGVSISRSIRDQVRLAARYVTGLLEERKASKFSLSGAVRTPSRGLLLSRYSTDPKIAKADEWLGAAPPAPPRGIRVKVKPGGPTKTLSEDYFYMVLPKSKRLAIARRRDKPGPKGGKIDVAYGPSVSQVFSQNTLADVILPAATELYQFELLDAMRSLLVKQFPQE